MNSHNNLQLDWHDAIPASDRWFSDRPNVLNLVLRWTQCPQPGSQIDPMFSTWFSDGPNVLNLVLRSTQCSQPGSQIDPMSSTWFSDRPNVLNLILNMSTKTHTEFVIPIFIQVPGFVPNSKWGSLSFLPVRPKPRTRRDLSKHSTRCLRWWCPLGKVPHLCKWGDAVYSHQSPC